MNFTDFSFLFLILPLVVFIHKMLSQTKLRIPLLLLFSAFYYFYCSPTFFLLFCFMILMTYWAGMSIKKGKTLVIVQIIFLLSVLGYFKYFDFLIEIINGVFHQELSFLCLGLPLGVSFTTFQSIGYLSDVANQRIQPEKKLINFAVFLSFFPVVASGPILRYQAFGEQLVSKKIGSDDLANGLRRFLVGLVKKVICANQLGLIADAMFDNPNGLGFVLAWFGAIAYMMQIYLDFSGYSDMAIGLGQMLGFSLPENFKQPYSATSIQDFWKRWHISLSSWFKDYVYIPLGGSRCKTSRWIFNLFVVWACTGLWHGAAWNFILWGVYFGVLLILEKFIGRKFLEKMPIICRRGIVLALVLVSWVLFRANNLEMLKLYFVEMVNFSKIPTLMELKMMDLLYLTPVVAFSLFLCTTYASRFYHWIDKKWGWVLDLGLAISFLVCISILVSSSFSPFIYFNF